jgi:hypothetical protein
MFGKNSSRRYETDEVTKPAANVVSRARRALGDITNSFGGAADGQGKEANKKPTLAAPSSSIYPPQDTARVDEDETAMRTDDNSRPYMKRESDNIDSRDGSNPLLCTAYINDMYELFHTQERQLQVNANYMANQPNVNERMRAILVDWLVSFHPTYILHHCTINLFFSPVFRLMCTSSSRWCPRPST